MRLSRTLVKLRCSHFLLWLHSLVTPCRETNFDWKQRVHLYMIDAWPVSGLSFKWFYRISGSSAKHSKSGACSSFLGLLPYISHRRLPNSLFVLFNPLLFLLSDENIAFSRRANEVRGDQGKVFICVHDSLWLPYISQPCMSLFSRQTL